MEEERVAFIAQRRKVLIRDMNLLSELLRTPNYDIHEARARLEALRNRFHTYEDLNDELVLANQDEPGQQLMPDIHGRYYRLSARIAAAAEQRTAQAAANVTTSGGPLGNSTLLERQKQFKLPTGDVPKFSGNLEQWLSFRNTFRAMIDARTDVDNVAKFLYLKNSLEGEAAELINVYEPSDENYARAWKALTDEYERRRTLIAKHIDAILDIPPLTQVTYNTLNKIVTDTRQNVHMLELLKFELKNEYFIVRTLERRLPNEIRLKWEESLGRDEVPQLETFFNFMGGVVSHMRTIAKEAEKKTKEGVKRPNNQSTQGPRPKREKSGSRALATNIVTCSQCQGDHLVYRCPIFEKLTSQQRWDAVKAKQLCRNCLRKHSGECTNKQRCKRCSRFHHTLLHTEKPAQAAGSSTKATSGASV